MRSKFLFLLSAVVIAWPLFSGCSGPGGRDIWAMNIWYKFHPDDWTIPGAGKVRVRVNVADEQSINTNVEKKGCEYRFLGEIITLNDIPESLSDAIESELQTRGFRLGDGPVEVYL